MISVRPINAGEEAIAAQIEKECLSTAWTDAQIRDLSDKTLYLVALSGDTICGIASVNFVFDDGEILNIAVSMGFRGRGIGGELMKHILREAKLRSITALTLEVAENNKSAIALYEKFGFTPVGKRKGFYGNTDGIVYQLTSLPQK